MTEAQKSNRYPGGKPFMSNQSSVFFGRDNDIRRISLKLATERFIVLFSKSGIGKTSLVNAGLIPHFETTYGTKCEIIKIRFNAGPDESRTPVQMFVESTNVDSTILNQIPVLNVSLWQSLKSRQFDDQFNSEKQYLIILDQFEELFNHDDKSIEDFKIQLSNLYNNKIPSEFSKTLKREIYINQELRNFFNETDLEDKLLAKIPIKILISIRSDKLSLLNRFKDHFPELLLNCYELEPLNVEHAREAITKPAQLEGNFASPIFQYSNTALDCIVDFLSAQSKKWIESFHLQIICQYIEECVINDGIVRVEDHHLSGKLNEIIREYYENEIYKIAQDADSETLRKFVEERLILARERRRVSLDEGFIRGELGDDLSQRLFKSNLLRSEPNNQGGSSYELSHDSLVGPILTSKSQRKDKEEKELNKLHQKRKLGRIVLISASAAVIVVLASFSIISFVFENQRKKELGSQLLETQAALQRQSELNDEANIIISSLKNNNSAMSEANKIQLDSLKKLFSHSLTDQKKKYIEQKNLLTEVSTSASSISLQITALNREKENLMRELDRMRKENQKLIEANNRFENRNNELRGLASRVSNSLRELGIKIDSTHNLNNVRYTNDAYVRRVGHWYRTVHGDFDKLNRKMINND